MLRCAVQALSEHVCITSRSNRSHPHFVRRQKLDTERAEAVDLLSHMVARSLNFDKMATSDESHDDCLANMQQTANAMKEKLSANNRDPSPSSPPEEEARACLDTLLRAYEFSLDVKRSSRSARRWLESIERAENNDRVACIDGEAEDGNDAADAVALRAQLRRAEKAIASKHAEFVRANDELSKCRAEIGRLRNSFRTQVRWSSSLSFTNLPFLGGLTCFGAVFF